MTEYRYTYGGKFVKLSRVKYTHGVFDKRRNLVISCCECYDGAVVKMNHLATHSPGRRQDLAIVALSMEACT